MNDGFNIFSTKVFKKSIHYKKTKKAIYPLVKEKFLFPSFDKITSSIVSKFLKEIKAIFTISDLSESFTNFMKSNSYEHIKKQITECQNSSYNKESGLMFRANYVTLEAVVDIITNPYEPRSFPTNPLWLTLDADTSEIGYLFIDRTRIRQNGFCLGEHVYTMSLAPGEEVVLEQKSYKKEIISVEDTIEREFEQTIKSYSEILKEYTVQEKKKKLQKIKIF